MNVDYSKRRKQVGKDLPRLGLDGLVVAHAANWYYLTGFTGESGALVIIGDESTLLTDGRFTVQAKNETSGIKIELQKGGLYSALGELLRREGIRRFGFDPGQLTVSQWKATRKAAGASCKGTEVPGLVEGHRKRKDAVELALMRKAAILAGQVLEDAMKLIRPGVRESEIAAEIEYQMRKRGASGPSFETIVASGWRGGVAACATYRQTSEEK